jgi:hypothetical protein
MQKIWGESQMKDRRDKAIHQAQEFELYASELLLDGACTLDDELRPEYMVSI